MLIINYIRKKAGQGAITSLVQTTPQPQQPISTRNPFAPQVAPPPKLNEEKLKKLMVNGLIFEFINVIKKNEISNKNFK